MFSFYFSFFKLINNFFVFLSFFKVSFYVFLKNWLIFRVWTRYWSIPSMDKPVWTTDEHFLKRGAAPNFEKYPLKCFHPDTIGLSDMLSYFPFPSKPCQIGEVSPRGTGKTANSTTYIQSNHNIRSKIQTFCLNFIFNSFI